MDFGLRTIEWNGRHLGGYLEDYLWMVRDFWNELTCNETAVKYFALANEMCGL